MLCYLVLAKHQHNHLIFMHIYFLLKQFNWSIYKIQSMLIAFASLACTIFLQLIHLQLATRHERLDCPDIIRSKTSCCTTSSCTKERHSRANNFFCNYNENACKQGGNYRTYSASTSVNTNYVRNWMHSYSKFLTRMSNRLYAPHEKFRSRYHGDRCEIMWSFFPFTRHFCPMTLFTGLLKNK